MQERFEKCYGWDSGMMEGLKAIESALKNVGNVVKT
jgi:hypothetical protein